MSNIPGVPQKTSVQCKSFDQRMKETYYGSQPESKKVDLLAVAISYLRREALDSEDKKIIQDYVEKMK